MHSAAWAYESDYYWWGGPMLFFFRLFNPHAASWGWSADVSTWVIWLACVVPSFGTLAWGLRRGGPTWMAALAPGCWGFAPVLDTIVHLT